MKTSQNNLSFTIPEGVEKDVSLTRLNSFGVACKARYFFSIENEEALTGLTKTRFYREMIPPGILGGGSNILLTGDFEGLLLHVAISGIKVVREDKKHVWIEAGAGENWHNLVIYCVEQGWGGIENLSLIPGTTGAAPIQNIGAYGAELSEVFDSLSAVDLKSGEVKEFAHKDCSFSYRYSIFKGPYKGRYLITRVRLRLNKEHKVNISYGSIKQELEKKGIKNPGIADVSRIVIKIRQSKLPDPKQTGNAGSFFKNPLVSDEVYEKLQKEFGEIPAFKVDEKQFKIPAGWLIEQCGLKGIRSGNAGTWPKQALVLVNRGGATGRELLSLANDIAEKVKNKFGIKLEKEVNVW